MRPKRDPFEVLGVYPGATEDEVRVAWSVLAKKYHPDVSDAPDANERMAEINAARDYLMGTGALSDEPQRREESPDVVWNGETQKDLRDAAYDCYYRSGTGSRLSFYWLGRATALAGKPRDTGPAPDSYDPASGGFNKGRDDGLWLVAQCDSRVLVA